jgi:thioredoxin reductase
MSGTTTGDWWQYSRWIWNIARSMRINPPSDAENTAVETFLKTIYDVDTGTGTRPWLATMMNKKSVSPSSDYEGDVDDEPSHIDVKMLGAVGRDLKKVELTDAEKTRCDTLIAATGNRYLRESS